MQGADISERTVNRAGATAVHCSIRKADAGIYRARVSCNPFLPAQRLEAVEGKLDILVPVHLEDVAPLLVNCQAPLHVSPVKLEVI